jgi:hypothetical protein
MKVFDLLIDRVPCRHRWYEQDSGGENTADVRAGYNKGTVPCLGREPKSSFEPPVASSCPFSRRVATVYVGWEVGDRHLAVVAQIERARGGVRAGALLSLAFWTPLL